MRAEELLVPAQKRGYTVTEYGIFLDQRANGLGVTKIGTRVHLADAERACAREAAKYAPLPVQVLARTVVYGDWRAPDVTSLSPVLCPPPEEETPQ